MEANDDLFYYWGHPSDWRVPAFFHEIPQSIADMNTVFVTPWSSGASLWPRDQIIKLGWIMRRWKNNVNEITVVLNAWLREKNAPERGKVDIALKVEEIYVIFFGPDYAATTGPLWGT